MAEKNIIQILDKMGCSIEEQLPAGDRRQWYTKASDMTARWLFLILDIQMTTIPSNEACPHASQSEIFLENVLNGRKPGRVFYSPVTSNTQITSVFSNKRVSRRQIW